MIDNQQIKKLYDSKRLQSAILAILSLVFLEGFGAPLSAETIFTAFLGFATLVGSYGLEDALRKLKRQGRGAVQRLWNSKRFWVVFITSMAVILADVTDITYTVEMFGVTWTVWSAGLTLMGLALGVITLEDLAEASEPGPSIKPHAHG